MFEQSGSTAVQAVLACASTAHTCQYSLHGSDVVNMSLQPHNVLLQHRKSARAYRPAALDEADEAQALQQSHPGGDGGTYQASHAACAHLLWYLAQR